MIWITWFLRSLILNIIISLAISGAGFIQFRGCNTSFDNFKIYYYLNLNKYFKIINPLTTNQTIQLFMRMYNIFQTQISELFS